MRANASRPSIGRSCCHSGPAGTAGVSYNWGSGGARYTGTLTVGSAPTVDRLDGTVDPRVFWAALLSRQQRKLTLQAGINGASSLEDDSTVPISNAAATAGVLYEAVERLLLRAGATVSSELIPGEGRERPPPLWTCYVGLSYALQPMKL